MGSRRCFAVVLVIASGTALAAEEIRLRPPELRSAKQIAVPAPNANSNLRLPLDARTPDAKIASPFWLKLLQSHPDDVVKVIVQLHNPVLPSSFSLSTMEDQAVRAGEVATIERAFVAEAAPLNFRATGSLSHFPVVFGEIEVSKVVSIARLPYVDKIFEDEIVHAMRVQGGNLMKSPQLRTMFGGSGLGVEVAVLDTGISPHTELGNRVVAQADLTATTGNGTIDDNGHGTWVAGIIAGSQGIAPQANLWAIKVLKADGNSTSSSVMNGLDLVYANRNGFGGLDIINMSLGGGPPQNSDCDALSPFSVLFAGFETEGIPIFVASGNDGFLNGISHPACHSKVVAVGAVYDASVGLGGTAFPAVVSCPGWNNCSRPDYVLLEFRCTTRPFSLLPSVRRLQRQVGESLVVLAARPRRLPMLPE